MDMELWKGGSLVPADKNPYLVYVASLRKSTQEVICYSMQSVVDIWTNGVGVRPEDFPWWQVRYEHIMALRASLQENYAPTTCNMMLSYVRCICKTCWRLGYVEAEEMYRAIDVKQVKGDVQDSGRAASVVEILQLIEASRGTLTWERDIPMIMVMYNCGLRSTEVSRLLVEDYSEREKRIFVRDGKGGKNRKVYVGDNTHKAILNFLRARKDVPGSLFCGWDQVLGYTGKKFNRHNVNRVISKLCNISGVEHIKPHDLRRTCLTHLLESGVDLLTVQKIAGHSNPQTTAIYDRRNEKEKMEAVRKIDLPDINNFQS